MVDTYREDAGGGGGRVGAVQPGPEHRDEQGMSMLLVLLTGAELILPGVLVEPGLGQDEALLLLLEVVVLPPLGTLQGLLLLLLLLLQLEPERYCCKKRRVMRVTE